MKDNAYVDNHESDDKFNWMMDAPSCSNEERNDSSVSNAVGCDA
jgi:hypothetical protein